MRRQATSAALAAALAVSVMAFRPSAAGVPPGALTAQELVARVIGPRIAAGFRIHATLTRSTPGTTAADVRQLLITGRRDRDTFTLYQQLWPAEAASRALVMRVAGDYRVRGFQLQSATVTPLTERMNADRFFDSDLRLEDLTLGFMRWRSPRIVGEEAIGEYRCMIVEFKPGPAHHSSYSLVKAWVSAEPPVVVRVQQFGRDRQLLKQIDLYRMLNLDGRWLSALITIDPAGHKSRTVIEGVKYDAEPNLSAADFSVGAIRKLLRTPVQHDPSSRLP